MASNQVPAASGLEALETRIRALEERLALLEPPPADLAGAARPGDRRGDDTSSIRAVAVSMRMQGAPRTTIVNLLANEYDMRDVERVLDEADLTPG